MPVRSKEPRTAIRKNGVSYIHIARAASLLGCSLPHARGLCDKGELPGRLVGGAWYVPEEALLPYLRRSIAKKRARQAHIRTESLALTASIKEKARHAARIVGTEIRRGRSM